MPEPARRAKPHVLLLTGAPGIGKTTVIRRLAERLEGRRRGGFYTAEIRGRGARRGFRLVDFTGRERTIAHVTFTTGHRVGKYGVDIAAIDEAAAALVPDPLVDVHLVDEIGNMECFSTHFCAAVRTLLDDRIPVVATVAMRGGGLIAEVKSAQQARLWEVTRANRDDLPSHIIDWLEATWAKAHELQR